MYVYLLAVPLTPKRIVVPPEMYAVHSAKNENIEQEDDYGQAPQTNKKFYKHTSQGQVQQQKMCNWTTVSNYYNVFIYLIRRVIVFGGARVHSLVPPSRLSLVQVQRSTATPLTPSTMYLRRHLRPDAFRWYIEFCNGRLASTSLLFSSIQSFSGQQTHSSKCVPKVLAEEMSSWMKGIVFAGKKWNLTLDTWIMCAWTSYVRAIVVVGEPKKAGRKREGFITSAFIIELRATGMSAGI